jgi:hypothetical protein
MHDAHEERERERERKREREGRRGEERVEAQGGGRTSDSWTKAEEARRRN